MRSGHDGFQGGAPRSRVRAANDKPINASAEWVVYWMIAARRASSNFALDRAVARYNLPPPQHLHLHNTQSVEQVLAGATAILASDRLKTIVFTLAADDGENLAARLATQKWYVSHRTPMTRGRAHVVLTRVQRAMPPIAASR